MFKAISGINGFIGGIVLHYFKQIKYINLIIISTNLIIKIFNRFEIYNSKIKRLNKEVLLSSFKAINKVIFGKIE